ncbi:MAG TPA: class I SAM-dependent methyltransferase [Streptosporangiaceae bacterium]|nr:class I SAM-dependent methyltransferase [Streptosporangiaceae bacterium]
MADRETRRQSFGSVAADYDRYRPGPPEQALDWVLPPHAEAVLDLAAGTGAVTRELIGRVPRVIAVEPDERMRAVLSARCPEAEVLAGRGEDIPLPGASVDAVLISSAWHWLDPEQAVPEIARVLRVGGRLGVMWTHRDQRAPWVAEFNRLSRWAREADRPRDQRADAGRDPERSQGRRRRREVAFPPGIPLSQVEERAFEFSLPRTKDELAGLLGTYSGVITLAPGQRAELTRQVRAFLDRQPWDRIDLPMICRCVRSTRLPA